MASCLHGYVACSSTCNIKHYVTILTYTQRMNEWKGAKKTKQKQAHHHPSKVRWRPPWYRAKPRCKEERGWFKIKHQPFWKCQYRFLRVHHLGMWIACLMMHEGYNIGQSWNGIMNIHTTNELWVTRKLSSFQKLVGKRCYCRSVLPRHESLNSCLEMWSGFWG